MVKRKHKCAKWFTSLLVIILLLQSLMGQVVYASVQGPGPMQEVTESHVEAPSPEKDSEKDSAEEAEQDPTPDTDAETDTHYADPENGDDALDGGTEATGSGMEMPSPETEPAEAAEQDPVPAANAGTGTYYVDSENGDDAADGMTEATAWKTLDRINQMQFKPGDEILLKRGSVFSGQQLKPNGEGTQEEPIKLYAYGEGSLPLIQGNAENLYAVHFVNTPYWEVSDIEVTNWGEEDLKGRTGIVVQAENYGTLNHFYLRNVLVHDVNGDSVTKDYDNGGIYFGIRGQDTPSKFNDILLENVTVKDVNRTAISVGATSFSGLYNDHAVGEGYGQEVIDQYSSTNVIIRNCYIENAGGDSIVTLYCDSPVVEYNISNAGCATSGEAGQYSAGIWPWRCEDALFQYNEVYNSKPNGDGQAWDLDWANRTLYQYNYSHGNTGGALLICKEESNYGMFRYNISQNDTYFFDHTYTGGSTAVIHNNTFYAGPDTQGVDRYSSTNTEPKILLANNIFYNGESTNRKPVWQDGSLNYYNNLYYGYDAIPNDNRAVSGDPLLRAPGTGNAVGAVQDNADHTAMAQGYELQKGSPAINSGVFVEYAIDQMFGEDKFHAAAAEADYFGNALYNGEPDIGAHEFSLIDYGKTEPHMPYKNGGGSEGPGIQAPVIANADYEDTKQHASGQPWNQGWSDTPVKPAILQLPEDTHNWVGAMPAGSKGAINQTIAVTPNADYILKVWAKIDASDEEMKTITNPPLINCEFLGGGSKTAPITTNTWQEYTLKLSAGSATQLRLGLQNYGKENRFACYADDWEITAEQKDPEGTYPEQSGTNKSVLATLIADVRYDLANGTYDDKTPEFRQRLTEAVDRAQTEVMDDPDAGQEEVDKAVTQIRDILNEEAPPEKEPTAYYVDSESGDDSNTGTSQDAPWKSLSKVNAQVFNPGDQIYLKRGSVFTEEQLKPRGEGSNDQPIILDAYGEGNLPLIQGNGKVDIAVHFVNTPYWEVSNIEVTNQGEEKKDGRTGIMIENNQYGILRHFYLKDVYVHDVNGSDNGKNMQNGGIYARVYVDKNGKSDYKEFNPTKFEDLVIDGARVENVNRVGISVACNDVGYLYNECSAQYPEDLIENFSSTDVVVRNCYIKNAGGDSIIAYHLKGGLFEYNVSDTASQTSGAAGQYSAAMWPWRCVDTVYQYNEAFDTLYNGDAQAWDCDSSTNTLFQYNYSHGNMGGCVMFCRSEAINSVFRYNISQNDYYFIDDNAGSPTAMIYNNTFYGGDNTLDVMKWNNADSKLLLQNNIFYNGSSDPKSRTPRWNSVGAVYYNNLYYGYDTKANDPRAIVEDPLLKAPGTAENGRDTAGGYQLTKGSPAINAGVFVDSAPMFGDRQFAAGGDTDYFGNELYNGDPDIGAHEFAEIEYPEITPHAPWGITEGTGYQPEAGAEVSQPDNPGYEEGTTGWKAVVYDKDSKDDQDPASYDAFTAEGKGRDGGAAACIPAKYRGGIEQKITGLEPNTSYKVTVWGRIDSDDIPYNTLTMLEVKNFIKPGTGQEAGERTGYAARANINSNEYQKVSVMFTTDAESDSAVLRFKKDWDQSVSYTHLIVPPIMITAPPPGESDRVSTIFSWYMIFRRSRVFL